MRWKRQESVPDLKGIVPRYKGWLPANEAGRAHAVNEHGAWRIAGKFARVDSNQPAEARSVGCSTFQAAYLLSSLYLSVFLLFGRLYRWRLRASPLDFDKIFALHVLDLCELSYTTPWYWACPYFLYPL